MGNVTNHYRDRAETEAIKRCPINEVDALTEMRNARKRAVFCNGYEAGEEQTIERASEWWKQRLVGFLGEGLSDSIINEFKDYMTKYD